MMNLQQHSHHYREENQLQNPSEFHNQFTYYINRAPTGNTCGWLRKQRREIKTGSQVTCCGCATKHDHENMFRCLYCGKYHCLGCAEEHFGQTREEYEQEKREQELQERENE